MHAGYAIAAGLAAALGLVSLWFWKKFRDETVLMASTPTSRAADVATMAPGTLVEVKGTIRCAAPFAGEFSQQPCVYAKSEIVREEVRWRDGRRETNTIVERSTERHTPFHVEDDSGRVLVHGEGASVEAAQAVDISGASGTEALVSLATSILGAGSRDRRLKEYILAPDIPVYVLGTVIASGAIGAAPQGAKVKEFIITHKSEEERSSSSNTTALIMLGIAVALFIAAIVALVAAFR